jgi:hypothetical protein
VSGGKGAGFRRWPGRSFNAGEEKALGLEDGRGVLSMQERSERGLLRRYRLRFGGDGRFKILGLAKGLEKMKTELWRAVYVKGRLIEPCPDPEVCPVRVSKA